jgi:hypothetical protein
VKEWGGIQNSAIVCREHDDQVRDFEVPFSIQTNPREDGIYWVVGSKSNDGIAGTPTWSLQDPYRSKGPNSIMPAAAFSFLPGFIGLDMS